MRNLLRSQAGFTLIELVIIIVVLGILAAVAIPKYQNITQEAKESACRGSLANLRSGISIYYANQAIKGDSAVFPPYDSLIRPGVVMLHGTPKNPYQRDDRYPDSIVLTTRRAGRTQGNRGGWLYNETTGQIWPNTTIAGENEW